MLRKVFCHKKYDSLVCLLYSKYFRIIYLREFCREPTSHFRKKVFYFGSIEISLVACKQTQ